MSGAIFKSFLSAVVVSTGLTVSSASASTVDLEYLGPVSGYRSLKIVESPATPAGGSLPAWVHSGAYDMIDKSGLLGRFVAFCLDIGHTLGSAGASYGYKVTKTPFSNSFGVDGAQKARIQNFFDANYFDGLALERDQSAAFQMGLWEVLYDDDFKLYANTTANDDFRGYVAANSTSMPAYRLAGQYLVNAETYNGPRNWNISFLESSGSTQKQNLVTVSAVPLPAGMVLLLTGVAGMGLAARRRAKKQTQT